MFSDSTNPKDAVLLENLVIGDMVKKIEQEEKQEVDSLVVNSFVQKFNQKYKEELFEEQKTLLGLYIQSFVDNSVEFKSFLNEEITRLKNELKKAKSEEYIASDEEMTEKANEILLKLESFKKTEISDNILLTVLKVQSLIRETSSDGNSN